MPRSRREAGTHLTQGFTREQALEIAQEIACAGLYEVEC